MKTKENNSETTTDLIDQAIHINNITVDIPKNLKWDEYPQAICKLNHHILDLKIQLFNTERQQEIYEYNIKAKDWKGMGSNDSERQARLKLLLFSEKEYQDLDNKFNDLTWSIKRNEIELERLENEFKTKRLKFRSAIVQSELFGGLPIDPSEEDY
jgi:hypothetical protein